MSLEKALEAICNGKMILLFDAEDREGETDLVIPALCVCPADIARMRIDGGGLICVAIHGTAAERLGLPFMNRNTYEPPTVDPHASDISRANAERRDDKIGLTLSVLGVEK